MAHSSSNLLNSLLDKGTIVSQNFGYKMEVELTFEIPKRRAWIDMLGRILSKKSTSNQFLS
jgi:hypothetical protein